MSEKKVVKRTVALALGVVCILLIGGLGGAITYYTTTINKKNSAYDAYASTHSYANSDYAGLNSTYYNYMTDHAHSNADYNSLVSQNTNLQAWLYGNETLLNQTQTWLDGNITYYNSQIGSLDSQINNLTNERNQLQTWLNNNITYYNSQINALNSEITNLTDENRQLQTWLDGNVTTLEAQISTLNETITQMEEWLSRGPPEDHLAVANSVQAWYNETADNETWYIKNLTKQFLFNCMDQEGNESDWAWLYVNGSIVDAAAFMSITIKPASDQTQNQSQTTLEFSRCDGV
jgi:predicted  nucleic acid-binding Zn-ribbon protein